MRAALDAALCTRAGRAQCDVLPHIAAEGNVHREMMRECRTFMRASSLGRGGSVRACAVHMPLRVCLRTGSIVHVDVCLLPPHFAILSYHNPMVLAIAFCCVFAVILWRWVCIMRISIRAYSKRLACALNRYGGMPALCAKPRAAPPHRTACADTSAVCAAPQ